MFTRPSLENRAVRVLSLTALVLFGFAALAPAQQIHGVPASVTSTGFGGHFDRAPGIPASVTSTGSFALQPGRQFSRGQRCCITPLFPHNPGSLERGEHHPRVGYSGGEVYAVPYYVPYYEYSLDDENAPLPQPEQSAEPQDEYLGGPTIFDRRGPGSQYFPPPVNHARPPEQASAASASSSNSPSERVPDMPQTILVFRDGHQLEVSDYAIVGSTLFDLTPGEYRKIALAELDLPATRRQNDDRGVDFNLPGVSAK